MLGQGDLAHAGGRRPLAVDGEALHGELRLVCPLGMGPQVDVVVEHWPSGSGWRLRGARAAARWRVWNWPPWCCPAPGRHPLGDCLISGLGLALAGGRRLGRFKGRLRVTPDPRPDVEEPGQISDVARAVADGGGHPRADARSLSSAASRPRGHEAEVGEAAGDLLEDHRDELGRASPGGQGAGDRRRHGRGCRARRRRGRRRGRERGRQHLVAHEQAEVEPGVVPPGARRPSPRLPGPAPPRASSRAETWSARPSAGG